MAHYKHKFKPGRRILTITRFSRLILAGQWIYHNGKPMHPGWCQSWRLGFIIHELAMCRFREAIPTGTRDQIQ